MNPLSKDAKRVSLMLQYGFMTSQAVVDWADAQIVALDSPLAATPVSRTADLLSHLAALASDAEYWEAFRVILGSLSERLASRPNEAILSAWNNLYCTMVATAPTNPWDVPTEFQFIYSLLVALDGAEYERGRREWVLHEFLAKLRTFEKFKNAGAY
jgi:hypothetical protein